MFAALVVQSGIAGAADPFYEDQLRRGQLRFQAGDYEVAARSLRIASFGLLEEPPRLAEALTYLALAQAESGHGDAFAETFERLNDVEERFAVYDRLQDAAAKAAFEAFLIKLIPASRLRSTPAFSALTTKLPASQEESQSPAARRRDLRRRLEAAPEDSALLLAAARFELGEGRERRAADYLARAISAEPTSIEAHCMNIGLAMALDRCDAALQSLSLCPGATQEAPSDEFLTSCLVDRKRWAEANSLLVDLSEDRRSDPKIATLAALVAEQMPATSGDPAEGRSEQTAPTTTPANLDGDRRRLGRIRDLLDSATRPEDLDEPMRLATDFAADRPESAEAQYLAAEVAYRGADWEEAVTFFRRAGEPPTDRPLLQFYYAVSLFESGDVDSAADVLKEALPSLARTPFVESYARRILNDSENE